MKNQISSHFETSWLVAAAKRYRALPGSGRELPTMMVCRTAFVPCLHHLYADLCETKITTLLVLPSFTVPRSGRFRKSERRWQELSRGDGD